MSYTYLTTERLAERIQYEASTIRCSLKDSVLLEGVHYIRPFGGRKILYIWEKIEEEMLQNLNENVLAIPLSSGGYCNG
jgi:predicted transcriptional regulator